MSTWCSIKMQGWIDLLLASVGSWLGQDIALWRFDASIWRSLWSIMRIIICHDWELSRWRSRAKEKKDSQSRRKGAPSRAFPTCDHKDLTVHAGPAWQTWDPKLFGAWRGLANKKSFPWAGSACLSSCPSVSRRSELCSSLHKPEQRFEDNGSLDRMMSICEANSWVSCCIAGLSQIMGNDIGAQQT